MANVTKEITVSNFFTRRFMLHPTLTAFLNKARLDAAPAGFMIDEPAGTAPSRALWPAPRRP
jgi:hypothetical protein